MLVAVLFIGGATVDAKTPTRKTTSKTSRTQSKSQSFIITCLLNKEIRGSYNGFMFKSDSKLEAALKKAGFSLKSKKVTKGEIADGTEGDTAPGKDFEYVYTKKGITVKWWSYAYDEAPKDDIKYSMEISFSDSAAKKTFINSVKSNGFKEMSYGSYRDEDQLIEINVNGNKITIDGIWA